MDDGCFAVSTWSEMAYMNSGSDLMWDPIYNPVVVPDLVTKKDTNVAMWTFLTDTSKSNALESGAGKKVETKSLWKLASIPSGVVTPEVIQHYLLFCHVCFC